MLRSEALRCGGVPFLILSSSVATVRALSSSGVSAASSRAPASPTSAAKYCASSGFTKGSPAAVEAGCDSMSVTPSGARGTPYESRAGVGAMVKEGVARGVGAASSLRAGSRRGV